MNKIYQLLSLSQKGRNLISGEFAAKQAVLDNKAFLVIVSKEASENTKKLFRDKCNYRNISIRIWGESSLLGKCLGKDYRVVIALTNEKLATKILSMIDEHEPIPGQSLIEK
ncbi:MAG: hypothetical protein ATN31_02215 [Candidatus Epulonipiscioides saccharophilum]|nr:MAG: hypothetical protein ATN31_02215 [Epulopiscium sp. AS2M-Bin001]